MFNIPRVTDLNYIELQGPYQIQELDYFKITITTQKTSTSEKIDLKRSFKVRAHVVARNI